MGQTWTAVPALRTPPCGTRNNPADPGVEPGMIGRLLTPFFVTVALAATGQPDPTLAVINARVWTADPARPHATALAVAGERILAVGSDAEIRALVSSSTRVVDAAGATVTPGLFDAHIHLFVFDSGPLPPLFLRFVADKTGVAQRVAARAAALPKKSWILGVDWPGTPLTRAFLDRAAPDHPVWLTSLHGDTGMANTAALHAAGISRDTPDDSPGGIERDARGEPTGVIRGGPMWRVEAALVECSRQRDDRAIESQIDQLVRAGVTSVHHNNNWTDFLILQRLRREGRLHLRVFASPPLDSWPRLRDYIAAHGRGDCWLRWGAVKGYGAITAARYGPLVSDASRAGLQIMVHVGSNDELRILLDIFERVRRELSLRDPRFRVEHAHDMPADAIYAMVRAGALASWQPPLVVHYDQRARLGAPLPVNLFACQALLAAGVRIAFGTDTQPGEVLPPMASLQMALERAAPDGTRLSLDEGLRALTRDAAWAEFAESEKGTLSPGMLADLVVFDRDLFQTPVPLIHEVKVRMTVIGGKVAFE